MKKSSAKTGILIIGSLLSLIAFTGAFAINKTAILELFDKIVDDHSAQMISEGREIFRYDTFGSENFWGGKLRLHETIMGHKNGGIGTGVSLWARAQGGYYHDGRFADLPTVVDHYDNHLGLNLMEGEKSDLVEFLKSL